MPTSPRIRETSDSTVRVMLIDSNSVFRGACRALLMTEGVDVVAACAPEPGAIEVVRRLQPRVVLAEVADAVGELIASRICSLPNPPIVLLISTREGPGLAASVGAQGHLAKADVCAEAIACVLGSAPSLPTTH